jgi:hypothetical protein
MGERDDTGFIAGSRCLAAALSEKDGDSSRTLFRACARYYAKGATGEVGSLSVVALRER